ncbi:unnamed protein product, partial [Sphacelaria rigidula]
NKDHSYCYKKGTALRVYCCRVNTLLLLLPCFMATVNVGVLSTRQLLDMADNFNRLSLVQKATSINMKKSALSARMLATIAVSLQLAPVMAWSR